jgi:hypothetical protein
MSESQNPSSDGPAVPGSVTDSIAAIEAYAGRLTGRPFRWPHEPVVMPYAGVGGAKLADEPATRDDLEDDEEWTGRRHPDGEPDRGFTEDDLLAQAADEQRGRDE